MPVDPPTSPPILEICFPHVHAKIMEMFDREKGRPLSLVRWLRVLRSVAKEGSFYKAAQQLGYGDASGPRGNICEFQHLLGTELVRRDSGKGRPRVELTEIGTAVVEWISRHSDLMM